MKLQVTLFLMVILSTCKASSSGQEKQSILCKIENVPVKVTPTDLSDISNYIHSQKSELQFLKKLVSTESQLIKEASTPVAYNEDQDLNITELITKYGYTPEVHEVTTKDGYELTMHRIVGNGPVVFIMHALLASSDDWVTAGPNCLPYMLASEGYDVWLGNARGNKHSMKHVSRNPECGEFWLFGLDEISTIDLPTMIDYALNFTGKTNVAYVGHSQGGFNLVALCSDRPEYNEKISVAALLAPGVYTRHTNSPTLRFGILNPEGIYKVSQLLGLNNLAPNTKLANLVKGLVCGNNTVSKFICNNLISLEAGIGQLNYTNIPVILSHFPAGSSVRQYAHYAQVGRTDELRKFDFTTKKNLEVYGSEEPPKYQLSKVTAPVAVYYGGSDRTVNITDLNRLFDELPNVVHTQLLDNYSHGDVLWGETVSEYLYKPVIELIKEYLN